MINVQVLLFSVLKEGIGRDSLSVSLEPSSTGEELLEMLSSSYDSVHTYKSVIRIAVNESYVSSKHSLKDGDVVALITPVSGG